MTQVVPNSVFAEDILEQVEETLSRVNNQIRTISRKNSRCLEPVAESEEFDSKWGLTKCDDTAGLSSRSTSLALSRSNSILTSIPARSKSTILGKRSLSAGFMFSCDHPYDGQDGLCLEAVPEFQSPSSPSSSDTASDSSFDCGDKVEDVLGDVDFAFGADSSDSSSDTESETPSSKRRRIASAADCTSSPFDTGSEERAALTLQLLDAVARTDAGRTLLSLACNSNKRCRFSFAESIAESIPEELREQVLARITYDPSIKGTANRSEHELPARENMPPMIESLCAAGLLEGFSDCTTEVVSDEGGSTLRTSCVLDGESISWGRQACTSCGSCFSRFMYEEGKYTEFRKITKDITAGQKDWSKVAGHTLCEPCYRHFTKYGHLNNPRRVTIDSLNSILVAAAASSAVPGPQAKTRSRRAGGARRALAPRRR